MVGDIGGTNVRFGMARQDAQGVWTIEHFAKYPGADYGRLEDAILNYVQTYNVTPKHMSLAIAGPIVDGTVTLTNRAWSVSEAGLKQAFNLESALFFNDFAAMARSVPELSETDFKSVQSGQAYEREPVLVAGPGTGFGVAYLLPSESVGQKQWRVVSTEGGHIAYVPRTPEELVVRDILARDYGYVSLELVSSGSGLGKVHEAVCERHKVGYKSLSPDHIREKAGQGDTICLEVCKIRSHAVMGALGDLALAGGARGGIVLAGGVSERMIDFLMAPDALTVFLNRGARSDYMRHIPIRLMENSEAPLIGAAALYARALQTP